MFDLKIASKERHDRFVQRIVATREVWGLKSDDGWAVSTSTADSTKNKSVMPFWSDLAYAKQCAKDEWTNYEPTSINLSLFMERWLSGMAKDDCLVGTNWNAQLCGYEIKPLFLKAEIEARLKEFADGK